MNGSQVPGQLVPLSRTGHTVADPEADVRGRTALDEHGDPVGEVDDLFIDELLGEVRLLRIGSGGLLGLGRQHFLVPVEAVTAVEPDVVRLGGSRERLDGAPVYDPELSYDADYYANVSAWWAGDLAPLYPLPPRRSLGR
ncbi:PRC-barrel domain-containing protein [Modestobacter altitudinis]|uniref:PRC-barrel domain-containing protein n=1 Tax=Modestobacter altitudinis TaxID=2213158 RepID=UPI00110CCC65|nr:PRC-barrel domain-containing protein [Modestobacter altitudinis]